MRSVVLGFALGLGLLASETAHQAHPGHAQHQEVRVDGNYQDYFRVDADFVLTLLLLLASGFMALMVVFNALARKPCFRLASLGSFGAFMIILLFDMGCEDRSGARMVEQPVQPQHDAKELQTLYGNFKKDGVTVRADEQFLYIASNAFPSHPMMVGITAWQQQVPLPQPYSGENSWRIPLQPALSARPISARKALFRGAIALAVNGVPIFNALNNRREDAFLAGELDEFGGHCGRGDDYHYHVSPTHLEKIVGKGKPIAFALDGFPIYGFTDGEGKEPADLDEFNGRFEKDGSYRYYSTRKYPYINGGMRGVVRVSNDQIEPQPRDSPARPPGQPLRGAKVTGFSRDDANNAYTLKYDLQGKPHFVKYTITAEGVCVFVFSDGEGRESTETYRRQAGRNGPPPKKK
ncbi:MAG: YHYH protein [Gemmataceae bacterium]|nr:YHYH protein [Gemmataceae bacterium]